MTKNVKKSFHTGSVKKTIYLSKKRRDVGAIRMITFTDGNTIEEHIVAWKEKEYFTYVATYGLPLRVYVATIAIKSKNKKTTRLTWQSYFNSKKMSMKQFLKFVTFMGTFYEASLENLKRSLEGTSK